MQRFHPTTFEEGPLDDLTTGRELWRALSSLDSEPGYSQPVLVEIEGRRLLIVNPGDETLWAWLGGEAPLARGQRLRATPAARFATGLWETFRFKRSALHSSQSSSEMIAGQGTKIHSDSGFRTRLPSSSSTWRAIPT